MTRIINISLNVPESYGIEELTRQLTEYGERLISRRKRAVTSKKRHSQKFLKGLSLPKGMTDKELFDEYLMVILMLVYLLDVCTSVLSKMIVMY